MLSITSLLFILTLPKPVSLFNKPEIALIHYFCLTIIRSEFIFSKRTNISVN